MTSEARLPSRNHLAGETSPYLLQHASNPVDWYPWGDEALSRARDEGKPIFLSIGYAACHWCHVMERESFEDDATAAQLNRDFVAIKVDREERPDLDSLYMAAVQAMTGSGGWPMSVFLTPAARPFYGGTYFPAARMRGMPAFREVLAGVAEAWRDRRSEVEAAAAALASAVGGQDPDQGRGSGQGREGEAGRGAGPGRPPGPPVAGARAAAGSFGVSSPGEELAKRELAAAVAGLERSFDSEHGGWGSAPKFPQAMVLEFLLRRSASEGAAGARSMLRRTLDAMADGGIRDQLGGGFHRYSTDSRWLVPHFEKMLYDNAQLARVYLHAWQLLGEERDRQVSLSTLDYLAREMRAAEGGLAASQDADTGGREGATYTWTRGEIAQVLGRAMPEGGGGPAAGPLELGALFATAYGVTEPGNWEGRTVLARLRSDRELGEMYGIAEAEAGRQLARARSALLEARLRRPQPARDDKALASWNGLALAAFAEASAALGRASDLELAERLATFALDRLRGPDGRLARSFRLGRTSGRGVLEDYTHLADGLLALYGATFEERWFAAARNLADVVLGHFADPAGGFFDTPDDGEELFARPRDVQDNALPSGNAMATCVLLRLHRLTGDDRYRVAAEAALARMGDLPSRYPSAFGQGLIALDLAAGSGLEVAIVGGLDDPRTRELVDVARRGFDAERLIVVAEDPDKSEIELLRARQAIGGRPTAYVCRGFSCRLPVSEPQALAAELAVARATGDSSRSQSMPGGSAD